MLFTSSRARTPLRVAALGCVWIGFVNAPAFAAGDPIGDPTFRWSFDSVLSDGGSGTTLDRVETVDQVGGAVSDTYEAPLFPDTIPDGEVFANDGATTFWVSADAPGASSPGPGDPVGATAILTIWQSFRKDAEDASLSYTLTAGRLVGLDPSLPTDDRQPTGNLLVQIFGYDERGTFFEFADAVGLKGLGGGWEYLPATHWSFVVTAGSLGQSFVELSLEEPSTVVVDLSEVGVGDEFTLQYSLVADAVDTAQADTGISVYARDPMDPAAGGYFEHEGLTPTNDPILAPEPDRASLAAVGFLTMLAVRSRRARGARQQGSRSAGFMDRDRVDARQQPRSRIASGVGRVVRFSSSA